MPIRVRLFFLMFVCVAGFLLGQPSTAPAQSKAELLKESDVAYNAAIRLLQQRNFSEAERLALRSLELERIAGTRISYAAGLTLLGTIHMEMGRPIEAEQSLVQALKLHEERRDRGRMAAGYFNLAILYRSWRQFAKADEMTLSAIELYKSVRGKSNAEIGIALNHLAGSFREQGRLAEAEQLSRQAILILEAAGEKSRTDYANALQTAGNLFSMQGKFDEGEALFKRVFAIYEQAGAKDNAHNPLASLARNYALQGRFTEAEENAKRALELARATYGNHHETVGSSLDLMAVVYRAQGRYREAEQFYRQSIDVYRRINNPGGVSGRQFDLAKVHIALGQYGQAEAPITSSLPRAAKTYGATHPAIADHRYQLGLIRRGQGRWAEAVVELRHAVEIWKKNGLIGSGIPSAVAVSEFGRPARATVEDIAQALWHVSAAKPPERLTLGGEALVAAQYAEPSSSGAALVQMTARLAAGDLEIGKLVREAQDLAEQRAAVASLLAEARGAPDHRRSESGISELQARLDRIMARSQAIDNALKQRFPQYSDLSNPQYLSLTEIQGLLQDNEALVVYLATSRETLVWAVSRSGWDWKRVDLSPNALAEHVAALRCGLDSSAWRDQKSAARCLSALGLPRDRAPGQNDPLPFDTRRSHELYTRLLGPVANVIKSKSLLIVPSGPLTQLPFQVLVKEPPATLDRGLDGLREAAWLGAEQALTVLPTVSSLKALRGHVKSSKEGEPFFGVGDPVLAGSPGCPKIAASGACPDDSQNVQAASRGVRMAQVGEGRSLTAYFRSGRADLAQLRALCPLPDTADELRCVARSLGAADTSIVLGNDATEKRIKTMSRSGRLARYRVLHFATHGLLAGETARLVTARAEPALVLTPPRDGTSSKALIEDDGLLTASEIATLKLDADWVILSACNTAAAGAKSSDALSGLARAFFYAGARALLVSHWEVYSEAAVKLTTRAFTEMRRSEIAGAQIGRAEALRLSMRALIGQSGFSAHPSYWAPFVVVGEGAVR